jgi:hypothetical protein
MHNEIDDTLFDAMIQRIKKTGLLADGEAPRIANNIYRDGVVTLAEADTLFDLNDRLSGSNPEWDRRFVEAVTDFVLKNHQPTGWVSDDEADWLISRITRDGVVKLDTEMDLLLTILRFAEGAPERLGHFALSAACQRITTRGKATKDDVERVRRALYAPSGDGAIWVTSREADTMVRTNDSIAFAKNDDAWADLFVKAIANHLLARAHPSPLSESDALARERWLSDTAVNPAGFFGRAFSGIGSQGWFDKVTYNASKAEDARRAAAEAANREAEKVDEEESSWLMQRLGWDKKISPAERALIEFLKSEAPGFADGLNAAA